MNQAYSDVLKFSITLISIINPLGAIPVFLGFTKNHKNLNIKSVTNTCATACTITILTSLIVGQMLLNFFGISVASFTIGGGFLLFTMAFSMISGHQSTLILKKYALLILKEKLELFLWPFLFFQVLGPFLLLSFTLNILRLLLIGSLLL